MNNLALSCIFCNQRKGTDVGTILPDGSFTRFFNPRTDSWAAHFSLAGAVIESITAVGEATVRILKFNDPERVAEREELMAQARYPTLPALARIRG